jgi:formylglycine-generating enzyme required for sulfatase activity
VGKGGELGPRATRPTPLPWGDRPAGDDARAVANLQDGSLARAFRLPSEGHYEDGYARCAPIGSFPRDVSPCGAYDMLGNVAEWARASEETVSPETYVFSRGGSWAANPAWARASRKLHFPADVRSSSLGFRVSLAADPR